MTDEVAAGAPADDRKARRNVLVLAASSALGASAGPITFVAAALASLEMLGDDKSLATLPASVFVVGTACGTVPAALLMRRVGRRAGFIAGLMVSAIGSLLSAAAVALSDFALLVLGTFLVGFSNAFLQQFRFAAADMASDAFRPRAISLVMAAGVVTAVLGPQTVIHTADLFQSPFVGAFLGGAVLSLLGAVALLPLDIPRVKIEAGRASGRPLGTIVRQPSFLIALACATSSFAVMSFIMTAAPIAMVMHHHHRDDAVLGIQWHVLAMFAPSFFTGSLISRFGSERIVVAGLGLLIACALTGLAGVSVGHFWLALILLGIGWNFGFIGATTLVTETYRPEEKEKVQALNDFLIFGVVALVSFSAGEVLTTGGWDTLNIIALPVAFACLAALFWRTSRRPRVA
jgi:MFS family permease